MYQSFDGIHCGAMSAEKIQIADVMEEDFGVNKMSGEANPACPTNLV